MQIELFGLSFNTPRVTVYMWSPWRATALEQRLFEVVRQLPGVAAEQHADELRIHLTEPKAWRQVMQGLSRVLKGWQEDAADSGSERRSWRWLVEGDTDGNGYDHAREVACLWAFLCVTVERGGPSEAEKPEDVDLESFGIQIWPMP